MATLLALALAAAQGMPPRIESASAAPAPAQVGQPVEFSVSAADPDGDPLEYSWSFGDGNPPTPFSSTPGATHAYAHAGRYLVLVTVTDGGVPVSKSFQVSVTYPPTVPPPASSGTILHDPLTGFVCCVNPDADTVAAIDPVTLEKLWETAVGRNPRTLALAPDGTVWVVNQDDATLSVLDRRTGAEIRKIDLPYASRPYGIAFSPDGRAAYVTLEATGRLAKLDPVSRVVTGTLAVGPTPRAIAITGDSQRILVARFISPAHQGEVVEVGAPGWNIVRTFALAPDPGPDTDNSSRGVPNYLTSVTVTPDGRHAWVTAKKDNVGRGLRLDGQPLTFESTVRAIVSQIDLIANQEDLGGRIDLDDMAMASAVRFSPAGDLAFIALQGSNTVEIVDRYAAGTTFGGLTAVGLAPQGLALHPTGTTLTVQNFMSRTVAVFDTSGVVQGTSFSGSFTGAVGTVAREKLPPRVLFGKQLFYNANVGPRDHDGENRINTDGYLTCASCHLEGHADQRVWDFTQAGEGLRNTVSLLGRRGTGHGRVHWTANFDEIQDFEHPIRDLFGGTGLMDDAEFDTGTRNTPLGDRKAGLSVELDALAAYVASLDRVNPSPRRNPDSTLTADALAGKALFQSLNCVSCHAGPDFTDSASDFLHDVGTIRPSSGGRLGAPLTGLDTPTLKGIWETAPYLHDGSAANLLDVLTTANPAGKHGSLSSLTPPELAQLVAYLEQIDEEEAASPPSLLFVARLSGGRGLGKVVLKDDGTTALISLRPSGLSGTQTEAHLHGPGGMKIALPLGSFIDHVLLLTPPQVAQLKRGDLSFDVHTDAHPAGEAEGPIVDPYASPAAPGSSDRGCGMTGLEGLLTLLPFFFRRRFFR